MNSVVLGGSTGTSAAVVRALAQGDCDEVIGFHRGRHPDEAARVVADTNGRVTLIQHDVGSTYENVQDGLNWTEKALGRVHFFVHSLSGASVGTMLGQPADKVERTFALMAHSFLWWAQGLYERRLLAPASTLIALSNPAVLNYSPYTGVIGASKAALEAYVKTLAIDLGREGHRIFAIRFGVAKTPALEKIAGTGGYLETAYNRVSPIGGLQKPSEIGSFVRLLAANPDVTWALNGSIIDFDGGTNFAWMNDAIWHA